MRARAALATFLLGLGACENHQQASTPPPRPAAAGEHWQGPLSPRPTPEAVAVAEVNGDTIWDVDVARHAAALKLTPRAALDELIELELLAQEAERRGLADDPEVAQARKQARARALMQGGFAVGFSSPADVPAADIDLVWSNPKIFLKYNHQRYHEVRFARVELGKNASPAEVAAAQEKAEAIRAAVIAAQPSSKEAFTEAVLAAAQKLGIHVQTLDHAATKGGTVKEFYDAAFALTNEGEVSPVTRTEWGFDLLFLYHVIPEVHLTKQQAEPELRQQIFDESRRRAFLKWSDQLVQAAHVTRHDELLREDTSDEAQAQP